MGNKWTVSKIENKVLRRFILIVIVTVVCVYTNTIYLGALVVDEIARAWENFSIKNDLKNQNDRIKKVFKEVW